MKPLNLKETSLKEEMKERCLVKGQYKDEKAKDKFKMLCHLEDFEVQYWELQQENKQLKSILVELEEWLKDVDIFQMNFIENKNHITPFKAVLDKIQELKEKYK